MTLSDKLPTTKKLYPPNVLQARDIKIGKAKYLEVPLEGIFDFVNFNVTSYQNSLQKKASMFFTKNQKI